MKSLPLLPLLLLLLAPDLPSQPRAAGGEPAYRCRVATSGTAELAAHLRDLGYDVQEPAAGVLEACLSPAELQDLQQTGLQVQVLETARPLSTVFPAPEGSIPAGYQDLTAINAQLAATQAAHPGIALVVDAAAVWGPGATFEGRPINVIKISDNVSQDEDEPNFLLVSCHHARELVTPELALDLVSRLVTGYGSDPAITALVDQNEIWVAPVWNPDGYEYAWTTNNLWRKNRKPVGGQVGVDLNRNYPLGWSASCGGSTNPGSNTYRGPSPGSEEETQTMLAFSRDRRFAKVIDYHSFGREVLLSYACTPMPAVIESMIDAEGMALAALIGFGDRDPSADGEHQEWQIQEITSYAYLVETHQAFQPAFSSIQAEANTLWPLLQAVLSKDIPLSGHVTDAVTGGPLVADVSVAPVSWSNGETRTSEPRFGRYHQWLPPGTWTLTFSAVGYLSQTSTVTLAAATPVVLDVQLTPVAGGFALDFTTTGAADVHIGIQNVPASTTHGLLVLSFATAGPAGSGPLAGLWPDATSLALLQLPATPGGPFHWTWPVAPPLFPAGPIDVPPGGVPFPAGTVVDAVAAALGPQFVLLDLSPVVRLTL